MPLVEQGKAFNGQILCVLFPPVMQVIHAITAFCIPKVFYCGCHTGTDPKQK
jgi:hypothetical protein